MSTKIPDPQFPTPSQINSIPCAAADRYLQRVPEAVQVFAACQDPQNPSLVEVQFNLAGVFQFFPECRIVSVDGVSWNNFVAPLVLGHAKSASLPLVTNCTSLSESLVFDFSAIIPNFLNADIIEFDLVMFGTLNQAQLGLQFQPTTVTNRFIWKKGVTPKPIGMSYTNGQLEVTFEYQGNIPCACSIQCIIPSGQQQQLEFCPGEQQSLVVSTGILSGDPSAILLSFTDPVGNSSNISIQSLINVIPETPTVVYKLSPRRIEIGLNKVSKNGVVLASEDYKIYRYLGNPANAVVWKDWNNRAWEYFVDSDVIEGRTYGYAVMYKGEFQETSRLSEWAVVNL